MVLRRRNTLPPYEVMGAAGRKPAGHAPHPHPPSSTPEPGVVSRAPLAAPVAVAGEEVDWWSRTKTPMVLRVPRGLVAIAAVAILALIVMAYWVGLSRGEANEKRRAALLEEQANHLSEEVNRSQTPAGAQRPGPTTPNIPHTGGNVPAGTGDLAARGRSVVTPGKLQIGLSYFLLMTTKKDGADDLVKFLKDNQVEAGAFLGNNGRFYEVYALRGFPKDALATKERYDYEAELKQVGRRWKAARRGEKDFESIAPKEIRGETKTP